MLMQSEQIQRNNGTDNATIVIKWRDDTDAQSVLNYIGITFVRQTIRLQDIDWVASGNNCARMTQPINDERVTDYAAGMARGDVFPCPVVERTSTGFLVLGGNQRINAVKRLGGESCSAFVVQGLTTVEREAAMRSLNSRHGWGTSKTEAIAHAVYLVKSHGMSIQDAAYLMVVCEDTISNYIKSENMRATLDKHGVDSAPLKMSHLALLDKCKDERYQVAIAKVATSSGATADQIKSVVDAVNKQKTPAKMDVAFKEWAKEMPSSLPTTGIKKPRRKKFLQLLRDLNEFLERGNDGTGFSTLDELQCSEEDMQQTTLLASKIVLRLKTITGV